MRRAIPILALLVAAGAAGGCRSAGARAGAELLVSSQVRLADVPIPVHFARYERRSFDHVSTTERIVRHLYYAFRIPRENVAAFYRKQMPVGQWRPIGEIEANARRLMAFERGSEKCLIHIKKKLLLWTVIKIEVVGRPSGP